MTQEELSKCLVRVLALTLVVMNAVTLLQYVVNDLQAWRRDSVGEFLGGSSSTLQFGLWDAVAIVVWIVLWKKAGAVARAIAA